jgi:serine O-acetyltransferase
MIKQSFIQTLRLIKMDMMARSRNEEKSLTAIRVIRYLFKSASTPVVLYRWQVFFYQHRMPFIASLLKLISNIGFTVIIDSEADIGPGFLIYHSSYIFIGPYVKLGSNCHLANQNTIMASPYYFADARKIVKGPVIGDGLLMGCGASIVGDITLGDNVKISINSTVESSFPDNAVLIGVPAINIGKSNVE